ncbi:histidine--tRNA ligase [Humisphaera borealis]|uniref:Histidine--tRNA ligase n=1 Tax=Humisphaera borealis TaxID=2807512 RepID=A0A7M2WYW7_9BACT|nr:histidine--tRNA ligase [Humisphaera borealis]QOV90554.1 histidine--tRNA ligase [Humisphaera borealis]
MSTAAKITAPKGTVDILPAEAAKWQTVERIARETAAVFNFGEIRTPIFEHTELFHRGVGEGSDVVSKETYTFNDRGVPPTSVTLRPEGTAGVVRAAIENGLLNDQGARSKVYYIGPNFRYERPQKGRLRQHHQFGAEAFGVAEPDQDVECILLQMEFYRRCGVRDLELQVNSLGDRESKARYRDALVAYLSPKKDALSEDSQRRLEANPLRILDSKDPRDQEACKGAPPAAESLSDKSRAHFDRVQKLLTASAVPFRVNPNLVRGFDYYTETLWEVTAGGLGAQNAIGGGGRYDNLVEQLGGRPTPGVGFGSGLERLLLALEGQGVTLPLPPKKLVWLIAHGDAARDHNWKLLGDLRQAGVVADMDASGRSVKAQFKQADREQATHCIVVGEDELASGTVKLKDSATRTEVSVPRADVVQKLS